jgi:hypothetical protein
LLLPVRLKIDEKALIFPKNPQEMWDNIYSVMTFFEKGGILPKQTLTALIN